MQPAEQESCQKEKILVLQVLSRNGAVADAGAAMAFRQMLGNGAIANGAVAIAKAAIANGGFANAPA